MTSERRQVLEVDPASVNKNLRALLANHAAGPTRRDIVVLEGGTRSGKTWSVVDYLLAVACSSPGTEIRSMRADLATAKRTVVQDFLKLAARRGIWGEGKWNGTDMRWTHRNGSWIQFNGIPDDPTSLGGLGQDVLHLNEVMEFNSDQWARLSFRTRKLSIMDFNPELNDHFVFSQVLTLGSDRVLHVQSTFEDNPHLTPQQVAAIRAMEPTPENIAKGTADAYKWDVFGLGRRGRREGRVFEHWTVAHEGWPDSSVCQRWGFGLDFGFSLDPTVLVECAVHQDEIWLREVFRETGLVTNRIRQNPGQQSIEEMLERHGVPRRARIWSDQDPHIVAGLQAAGWSVFQAEKGKGSILSGIDLMKQRPIRIWHQSQRLLQEFEQYCWRRTHHGIWLSEPEDRWNHGIDAARYWARMEVQPRMGAGAQGPTPPRALPSGRRRYL